MLISRDVDETCFVCLVERIQLGRNVYGPKLPKDVPFVVLDHDRLDGLLKVRVWTFPEN